MSPSFDLAEWIVGFSLLGGTSVMLLLGLLLIRRSLWAVGIAVGVFIVGLAVCLMVDFSLLRPEVEAFFRAGSHKRRALRALLPWGVGVIAGVMIMGGWFQFKHSRWKRRLKRQNPGIFGMQHSVEAEASATRLPPVN